MPKAKKDKPAHTPGKPVIKKPLIKSANLFPVVGIGASAGGLDAFKKLLKAIPENSGMAFVLVQHLDPSHESLLPELLQKVTTIPVLEITDDLRVEPDHIYIIPSSKMLIVNDGKLEITPRPAKSKTERNLPIDLFFASLAEVHQSHAIGVVLSGTASDGTQGLKAIKDHGGITFAQDESSAAYDGMPNSAIHAGVVDFVLPPEQIPQKLLEITIRYNGHGGEAPPSGGADEDVFKQILLLLRIRKAMDFTYYKQSTIRRRILRRMVLNKNEEPADYLKYLRENKNEQDTLYQDLLIPVTNFFRDPKTFDHICKTVFPQLIKSKTTPATATEPIRIWVAGCSTGEEAYSIAICFKEYLNDLTPNPSKGRGSFGEGRGSSSLSFVEDPDHFGREGRGEFQIFASDISEPAVAKARSGIYTKADVAMLSPQRLKEFFTKNNGGWRVNKQIRDMCVFAQHNFLKDPPFGKLDFISCRNVLIYMEPYLQKKALTTFHYALNPNGWLLLGKSETVSHVSDLFAPSPKDEERSDKLFTRKEGPGRMIPVASRLREENLTQANGGNRIETSRTDFQKTADDIMLSKYTPAGVVVNEAMDIVHFRGSTGAYLEPSPGKPSLNLIKMAKNGLGFELRNILHKAKKEKEAVIKENIPVEVNGNQRLISIEAIPLPNMVEPHYLILFHDSVSAGSRESGVRSRESSKKKGSKLTTHDSRLTTDLRIQQLEKELSQTREDMRSITEDQEAANEELQSANEELLSSSEELQSLNEELETSKEELQSTIEELTVVNQEMISLNEQIAAARDHAENVITTVREPLLVLDKNLRIKTANQSFYKTFQANEQETEGKLIFDLGNKQWDNQELRLLLQMILPEKRSFVDYEVNHHFPIIGHRTMLLNAREVMNKDEGEKMILLAMEDITMRKQAEKERSLLATIVDTSDDAIISKSLEGIITSWNKGSEKIFGYSAEEAIGKNIKFIIPKELQGEEKMILNKIKKGEPLLHFDTVRLTKAGTRVNISLTVSPIIDKEGKVTGASKIARDITEQVIARKQIEKSEKRYSKMVLQSPFAFAVLQGKDMVVTIANDSIKEMWGKGKDNIEGKPLIEVLPEIKDQPFPTLLNEVFTTGIPYYGKEVLARLVRKGKMEDVYFNFAYQPQREVDDSISGVAVIAVEVTPEVEFNKKTQASEAKYRYLFESMDQGFCIMDMLFDNNNKPFDYRFEEINPVFEKQTGLKNAAGKTALELLPGLEKKWIEMYGKVALTGEPTRFTEGSEAMGRIFEVYAFRIGGTESRRVAILFTDITQRKKSESAIKESEERFRNLATHAPLFVWLTDANLHTTFLNKAGLDYFNWTETVEKLSWKKFIYPEHLERVVHTMTEAAKNHEPYTLEMCLKNAVTGKYRWFLDKAVPRYENDIFIGFIGTSLDIDDRKTAEKEIKESEVRYSALAKATASVIYTTDAEGGFVIPQTSWQQYTGQPWEEHKGWGWTNMIHENDREKVKELWSNAIAQKSEHNANGKIWSTKHNAWRFVETNAVPLLDEQGNVKEWVGSITDVHEQKMAEEKIKESEANFRQLAELMPDKVSNADAEGNIIYYNQHWLDYTGFSFEELKNWGWDKIIHADDLQELTRRWQHSLKTGNDFEMEIRLRNKEGRHKWHLSRSIAIKDDSGKITKWIATTTEIQAQKELREELEQAVIKRTHELSEANEELIQKNQEIALSKYNKRFLTDFSERFSVHTIHTKFFNAMVLYVADLTHLDYVFIGREEQNEKGESFIHTVALSAFGKLVENITYPLPDGPCEQVMHGTLYSYPENCQHIFPKNKTIAEFKVEGYIAYPLHDPTGNTMGLVAVMHEGKIEDSETISSILKIVAKRSEIEFERIQNEESLKQNNKTLAEKNEELVKMNKELESFNYISSHDLQEPLRKIQTFATRILEKEHETLSSTGKDYFHRMQEAANRMRVLIDDLLVYSRTNDSERKFENTDLGKIVEDVKTELNEMIQEKNATIEHNEMCEASIIPFQFHQLFSNLISNALKFSIPEKPPHIIIKSEMLQPGSLNSPLAGRGSCHISIADNGIGFDPQYSDRIFEVFQRLHGRNEYSGTGIGLAIVKKIIDNHDGIITASSEENKGATFDIYIPVR